MAVFQRLLSMAGQNNSLVRTLSVSKVCANNFWKQSPNQSAYSSDGKTTINILNSEEQAPMMVDGYSQMGFRLNNGIFVVGPVALFPHTILSWDVEGDEGINERSLSLFLHLSPKLDLLIIGISDSRNHKLISDTRASVHKMMREVGKGDKLNIEVMPTEKAVTTFNFVNSEQRFVGAALIPPTYYSPNLDDLYQVKYLQKKKDTGDFVLE